MGECICMVLLRSFKCPQSLAVRIQTKRVSERELQEEHLMNSRILTRHTMQAEPHAITELPSVPPMMELVTRAQLIAKYPHLLSAHRVEWALRRRATNGLSGAIFDSPCGKLLIHEPSFVAWFLGLSGRAKPRVTRRGRPSQSPIEIHAGDARV
jgi:hypothetical protein